jgi:UDP-glucose 4-epimerase
MRGEVISLNGRISPRRHLITGGAGFIGSHLADLLVARGDHVVVLDDLSTGRVANLEPLLLSPSVEFVEGSTLDARLVDELMRTVDDCLHLASTVGVQLVVSKPLECLMTNVRGTDVVLSAAARHGVRVLYTSTSEVYGKNSNGALNEDSDRVLGSPFKSRWAYAIAKSFGESMAHGLCQSGEGEVATVRLFNCVGPRQTGLYGMVLPRFVQQALADSDLTVYGDGSQMRCFAHVDDVVQAIALVLDHPDATGQVLNIGAESAVTILELAQRVIERTGTNSQVRYVAYDDAYADGFEELGRRQPDTAAVRRLTGWTPQRTLDDAIDDVIEYQRGGWDDVRRRAALAT